MQGQIISHFEVLELIGKGGMGVVYKCRDLELDRLVAIKFLVAELSDTEEAVGRFMREARAASSLDHPNICNIHEIGRTDDGNLFIVMALYTGDTLRSRMDAGLDVDQVIDLATQIARGLAAAHENGIVHRDVKPGNVVLTERDRAVIVDFGLATLPGFLAVTKTGSTLGTAAYMAPEQLTGGTADVRSDVWSLGVVLYEMLHAKRPFVGDYEQAISYAIVHQDPEPVEIADADPRLAQLQKIVERCLSKDPAQRYQDARELATDLNALGTPTHPQQAPESRPAGKSEPSPRKPRLVGISAILIATLIGVVAFFGWNPLPQMQPQAGLVGNAGAEASIVAVPKLLILPFENQGNASDDFFATGVSDEINGRLSTILGLSVISRRSAERYAGTELTTKEIGEELGVDYILEGQVRWARQADGENQVRISPMLIRVSDDTQLWAENYDRRIEDIFAIQADVATRVAAELDARLSESDRNLLEQAPTDNVTAYEEFLRGAAFFANDEFGEATSSLERALEHDPDFLRAAYLLSRTYSYRHFLEGVRGEDLHEDLEIRAATAMERVVAMEPGSAEAHLAAGYFYYYVNVDRDRAADEFNEAIRLRPGDTDAHAALGYLLRRIGRFHESAALLNHALSTDPNNPIVLREAARTHYYIRKYRTADSLFNKLIALDPLDERPVCLAGANLFAWKGASEEVAVRLDARPKPATGLSACTPTDLDLARRDFDEILSELETADEARLSRTQKVRLGITKSLIHRYSGNREAETTALREIAPLVEEWVAESSDRAPLIALSWIRALQADRQAVIELDERIDELHKNDRLLQLAATKTRAELYTLVGLNQEAIKILRADLESDVGIVTSHHLQLPAWDPLQGQGEFQALVRQVTGAPGR